MANVAFPYGQRVKLFLGGNSFVAEVLIAAKPEDRSIKVKIETAEGKLVRVGWIMRKQLEAGRKIASLSVVR